MRRLYLSFLGSGYIRPAPGTWGSLAALPAAWALYALGGPLLLYIATAAAYPIAVRAMQAEIDTGGDKDPSWVVIDEVIGMWIALLPIAIGAWSVGLSPVRLWPGIVAAFLLFRFFDIRKPWLVGKADQRGDATGVMLDDVWAGIFAAIGVVLIAALFHLGLFAFAGDIN